MRIPSIRVLMPAALLALAGFAWSSSQAPTLMGPSAEQKRLTPLVGEWEIQMTMHTPMGAMPAQGIEKNRLVCDGKWMESELKSEMMGMPFEGRMLLGWDAEQKAYRGVWVDSMGPAFTVMTGKWSEEGRSIEWTYESTDPTGRHGTNRVVEVMSDENTRQASFYFKPDGGAEELGMEMRYQRKGSAKPTEASGAKKPSGG